MVRSNDQARGGLAFLVATIVLAGLAWLLWPARAGNEQLVAPRVGPIERPGETGESAVDRGTSDRSEEAPVGQALESLAESSMGLLVTSIDGAPLDGARAHGVRGASFRVLGATNEAGWLGLAELGDFDRLVVRKAGFALEEVPVSGIVPAVPTPVVLTPEGRIAGSLVSVLTGQPVGGGARVVAWPSTRRMPRLLDHTLAAMDFPGVRSAVAGEDGSFLLAGLDPSQAYHVAAAGAGLVGSTVLEDVLPDARPVELPMGFLYALHFELVDAEGLAMSQLAWSDSPHGSQFVKVRGQPDPTAVALDDSMARLAGVEVPGTGDLFNLIVFYSELDAERIGPYRIEVDLPGREVQTFDGFAYRMDERFRSSSFRVDAPRLPLGELSVSFSGLPEVVADADRSLHGGVLQLFGPGVEPLGIACSFLELRTGIRLPGVPTGDYRVAFRSNLGFYEKVLRDSDETPVEVTILEGEVQALDVPLSDAAAIRLELLDRDGRPVEKHVGFEPAKLVRSGEESREVRKGTVRSRDALEGELPVLLVESGRYRVDPMTSVVGLDPPRDVGPQGTFVRPLIVDLAPGQSVRLLWQKF